MTNFILIISCLHKSAGFTSGHGGPDSVVVSSSFRPEWTVFRNTVEFQEDSRKVKYVSHQIAKPRIEVYKVSRLRRGGWDKVAINLYLIKLKAAESKTLVSLHEPAEINLLLLAKRATNTCTATLDG